jgi:hypothetical protein
MAGLLALLHVLLQLVRRQPTGATCDAAHAAVSTAGGCTKSLGKGGLLGGTKNKSQWLNAEGLNY